MSDDMSDNSQQSRQRRRQAGRGHANPEAVGREPPSAEGAENGSYRPPTREGRRTRGGALDSVFLGNRLLSSLLREGYKGYAGDPPLPKVKRIISNLSEDVFEDGEVRNLRFLKSYVDTHNDLPHAEALHINSIQLPHVEEAVSYYQEQIRNRQLKKVLNGRAIRDLATLSDTNPQAAGEGLEQLLRDIRTSGGTSSSFITTLSETLHHELDVGLREQRTRPRLLTGYPPIDEEINGLVGGDIIVFSGRPAMGKTYVIARMANKMYQNGANVMFISAEVNHRMVVRRTMVMMLSDHKHGRPDYNAISEAVNGSPSDNGSAVVPVPDPHRFSSRKILSGDVSDHMIGYMRAPLVSQLREGVEFYLDKDNQAKTTGHIRRALDDAENPVNILFIDAAYDIQPVDRKTINSENARIEQLIVEFDQIAKDYDIPVVLTMQENRESDKSKNAKMGHMRGSDKPNITAALVVSIRAGEGENKHNERVLEMLKVRNGVERKFAINFHVSDPFNLEYLRELRMDTEGDDSDDDLEANEDDINSILDADLQDGGEGNDDF